MHIREEKLLMSEQIQSDKEKASSLYGRKETTEKFMLTQRPQVVN